MIKVKKVCILSILCCLIGSFTLLPAEPALAKMNGEGIQTEGAIEITEDYKTPKPPAESSTEPTTEPTSPSGGRLPDTGKPTGKLPSTGELIKTSISITGAVLLVLAIALLLWKKRKKEDQSS